MSRPNFIVALCMAILLGMASNVLVADPLPVEKANRVEDPFSGGKSPPKKPHPSAVHKALAKQLHQSAAKGQYLRTGQAAIEEALAKPTQMGFDEMPLSDVIDFLKEYHGIEIQLDTKALADVSIGTDTPVTISLKGVSLRSALNRMLRDLGLTWTVQDEVLLITTREEADNTLFTKVYDVSDLVVCRDKHDALWDDYDTLIDMISSTVRPQCWDCVGGPGSIIGASLGGAKVLIVSQTYRVQTEIAELLTNIREVAKKNPHAELPRRNRPNPDVKKKGLLQGGIRGIGGFPADGFAPPPTPHNPPPDSPGPTKK